MGGTVYACLTVAKYAARLGIKFIPTSHINVELPKLIHMLKEEFESATAQFNWKASHT